MPILPAVQHHAQHTLVSSSVRHLRSAALRFCCVMQRQAVLTRLECAGRFGFVEMRTEELASSAMAMDKVDLCGRAINVGRPKGYVEPPQVCAQNTPASGQ